MLYTANFPITENVQVVTVADNTKLPSLYKDPKMASKISIVENKSVNIHFTYRKIVQPLVRSR